LEPLALTAALDLGREDPVAEVLAAFRMRRRTRRRPEWAGNWARSWERWFPA